MRTDNASIGSIYLGYEDHGILTLYLNLVGDGWYQGFGGYNLQADGELLRWVSGILKALERDSFLDLVGVPVRVEREATRIIRLGHFVKDKWFDPEVK